MVSYRLLKASDLVPLYECFLKAFADYQVDMQMSQELFEQRLARDGVQLESSAGAFDAATMIGFYMNGLGTWQGKQTAYDAGTGIVPEYRGRNLAKELFAFIVPRLQENSVTHYLLEVLSDNKPAVTLYRKLGFVETRTLAVLRAEDMIKPVGDPKGVTIGRVERVDWELFESFWDGYPSWQNSIAAVERVTNECEMVGAFADGKCVGYGVVFRPAGTLMQLAVAREYRRKGIGKRLLNALTTDESLKVNNVDERLKGTLAFFEANGFRVELKQFEMVKIF